MLKTKVIANNITALTDARYYAARYVDWLGFDFREHSENQINLQEAQVIKEWVEGPTTIGAIDILNFELCQNIIEQLSLDAVLTSMATPIEYLNDLSSLTLLNEVAITPTTTYKFLDNYLNKYSDIIDYFLFDFVDNHREWRHFKESKSLNIGHLEHICQYSNVFFQMDGTLSDMQELLHVVKPYGLSISSSGEEKTGYKSFEEIDDLFDWLEEI